MADLQRLHVTMTTIGVGNPDAPSHGRASLRVGLIGIGSAVAVAVTVMLGMIGSSHQFEVFRPIVGTVAVDVVNVFVTRQYSSNLALDDDSMLSDESLNRLRMFREKDKNVALVGDDSIHGDWPLLRGRDANVVAANKEPSESGVPVRAWNVRLRNQGALTTSAHAKSVSRVVGRWRPARPRSTLARFRRGGIHLVARSEMFWPSSLALELSATTARANSHISSIQQIGAV